MAQFPLETHSRGMVTVSGMLRDCGMEVIVLGNATPQQIVATAIQEDADIIGISTYNGGELLLAADLMAQATSQGIKDRTVFLLGGVFPPQNAARLRAMGFSGTFPPSSTREEIVACIRSAISTPGMKD